MKKSKLPKTLTTVTAFSKTLAVLLFFLFIAGSFRAGMNYQRSVDLYQQSYFKNPGSSSPTGTIMPTAETSPELSSAPVIGKTIIITSQDENKTIPAKIGDRVVVQLSDTMNWSNVQLSNPNVLQASPDGVFYIHAVQGRYKAVVPGTVDITATGSPICKSGEICPQFALLFKATVEVLQ